jgi:hypothetical protein
MTAFRVSWPFLATCGFTHIRVNMLQNPPISFQNGQQELDGKSEKSEQKRSVHHQLHLTLSGPRIMRKRHESVMNSSMDSGPKR